MIRTRFNVFWFKQKFIPDSVFADNAAFSGGAKQSSTARVDGYDSNPACAAVNGNPRHILCFEAFLKKPAGWCLKNLYDKNCILTAEDDYQAYWMVDLGKVYTVTYVDILRWEKGVRERGTEGKTRVCVYRGSPLTENRRKG